jgi:hypothetical protein
MDATVDRLRRRAESAPRRAVELSLAASQRPENVAARVRAGEAWTHAETRWKVLGVAEVASARLPVNQFAS